MANNRIKKSTPLLTSQGKRLAALCAGALLALCVAFGAGLVYGRQLGERSPGATLAGDPLAALDAPARGEEADAGAPASEPVKAAAATPAEFSFHQALTEPRPGSPGAPTPAPIERSVRVAALPPPPPHAAPILTSSLAGAAGDGGAGSAEEPAAPVPPPAIPTAGVELAKSPALVPAVQKSKTPAPLVATARAAAPKPTPRSNSEAIPAGAFSVQVGSAPTLENAQRLAARFKAHRPHIVASEVEGKGRWYRVRLGVFSTRAEAVRFQHESGVKGYVTASR